MSVGEWGVGGEGRERGPKGKRVALFLTKFPKTGSPMSSIYIYIYIYISFRKHSYIKLSRFQKINIFDRSDLHGS
jgi:hypothetical protein